MSYHTLFNENDNIYLNVIFEHNPVDGESPTQAVYNVTKTLPLLDKCSDYYCSVIRFDIPLDIVPLYIFPVNPGSLLTQISPMIIGVTFGAVDFPTNLIYVPDNTLPPVNQNNPNRQIITDFYFVYTYQNLITSINTALSTSYLAAGSPGGDARGPYFFYTSTTQLISLVIPTSFITAGATIFCNESLINYLDAFQVTFLGYNQPNGKDFQFITQMSEEFGYNPFGFATPVVAIPPPTAPTYFRYVQEYNVLVYWSSLRKLLITTNTIPINNEYIPPNILNSSISASMPIITDFTPAIQQSGDVRSIAYYTPTSQYRLVDMISERPLQTIDLKIYWEDKQGNIFPIFISQSQEASVKIGFFRKSLYKSDKLFLKA